MGETPDLDKPVYLRQLEQIWKAAMLLTVSVILDAREAFAVGVWASRIVVNDDCNSATVDLWEHIQPNIPIIGKELADKQAEEAKLQAAHQTAVAMKAMEDARKAAAVAQAAKASMASKVAKAVAAGKPASQPTTGAVVAAAMAPAKGVAATAPAAMAAGVSKLGPKIQQPQATASTSSEKVVGSAGRVPAAAHAPPQGHASTKVPTVVESNSRKRKAAVERSDDFLSTAPPAKKQKTKGAQQEKHSHIDWVNSFQRAVQFLQDRGGWPKFAMPVMSYRPRELGYNVNANGLPLLATPLNSKGAKVRLLLPLSFTLSWSSFPAPPVGASHATRSARSTDSVPKS